jgi:hypothetical protein
MVSQFKRMAGDKSAKNPTHNTPQSNTPKPARTINEVLRDRGCVNVAPNTQSSANLTASIMT